MLRVSGPDASEVKTIANDVKAKMQEDKDLHNIAFDWPDTEPVAQIHIDPDKARMLGINSYAVSLHLQSLLSGTKSGEYYEGNQTIDEPIFPDGENAYFSTLPIKAIVDELNKNNIPSAISNTAGTFVCNHIMYEALYLSSKKYPNIKAGFIHIPYIEEQILDKPNMPYMKKEDITVALELIIKTAVTYYDKEDTKITGGFTQREP